MNCRVCGRDIGPDKLVEKISEKLGQSPELAATCPRCRKDQFAREVSKAAERADGSDRGKSFELFCGRVAGQCDKE